MVRRFWSPKKTLTLRAHYTAHFVALRAENTSGGIHQAQPPPPLGSSPRIGWLGTCDQLPFLLALVGPGKQSAVGRVGAVGVCPKNGCIFANMGHPFWKECPFFVPNGGQKKVSSWLRVWLLFADFGQNCPFFPTFGTCGYLHNSQSQSSPPFGPTENHASVYPPSLRNFCFEIAQINNQQETDLH